MADYNLHTIELPEIIMQIENILLIIANAHPKFDKPLNLGS